MKSLTTRSVSLMAFGLVGIALLTSLVAAAGTTRAPSYQHPVWLGESPVYCHPVLRDERPVYEFLRQAAAPSVSSRYRKLDPIAAECLDSRAAIDHEKRPIGERLGPSLAVRPRDFRAQVEQPLGSRGANGESDDDLLRFVVERYGRRLF